MIGDKALSMHYNVFTITEIAHYGKYVTCHFVSIASLVFDVSMCE